jgi:hypothetical protein
MTCLNPLVSVLSCSNTTNHSRQLTCGEAK